MLVGEKEEAVRLSEKVGEKAPLDVRVSAAFVKGVVLDVICGKVCVGTGPGFVLG